MGGEAWRMPFFVFAAFTFVVAAIAFGFFRSKLGGALRLGPPFLRLLAFSAPTFVVIVALFLLAETLRWPEWLTATIATVIALVYIAIIVRSVQRSGRGPAAAQPEHLADLHRLHRDPVEPVVLQLLVGADRQGGGEQQPARRRR